MDPFFQILLSLCAVVGVVLLAKICDEIAKMNRRKGGGE